jgi:hypothetical protein
VRLIESPAIASYQVIRRDIGVADGKMRVKSLLSNDEIFEFFIYMVEANRQLALEKYSFHWQDKLGCLLIRIDNAPHFPSMPNAPHHVHRGREVVEALLEMPQLLPFLDAIEAVVASGDMLLTYPPPELP